jgi:hypothetical protein
MHVDMPAPPVTVITVRLFGQVNAVLAVEGRLDRDDCRRALLMLRALLDGGAREVIVDLSAAVAVPSQLLEALGSVRAELRARAGLLLVDGMSDDLREPGALVEAFDAYRKTLTAGLVAERVSADMSA